MKAAAKTPVAPPAYPGLDPSVVHSALASGVTPDALRAMSQMVQKTPSKLGDFPKKNVAAHLDVLGETDGEEKEEPSRAISLWRSCSSSACRSSGCSSGATDQHSRSSCWKEESQESGGELDDTAGYEVGASSSSGLGTHRRQAAILTALKKSLVEQPGELYQVIEKKMLEDFGSRELMPGEPPRQGSFRGWLEHRSHIPNIAATVRISWCVAGALDAIRCGKVQEGQTRLALLLAMLDQVACDRGSG